jgi:hypothetical protein
LTANPITSKPTKPTATAPRITPVELVGVEESDVATAETFTGLTVGQAVTMKRGVVVTGILGVIDLEGYAVIANRGVELKVILDV